MTIDISAKKVACQRKRKRSHHSKHRKDRNKRTGHSALHNITKNYHATQDENGEERNISCKYECAH